MASARSKFVRLMGIAFAAIASPQFASAVDYPTRQVRWLVPMAAGDMPDILARLMGQWLSDHLGQPFVIDNRPGAATNIGTEAAVRSPPGQGPLFKEASTSCWFRTGPFAGR
jgi:tripartite-type tricarboxylate transporter receptor subunit TctC